MNHNTPNVIVSLTSYPPRIMTVDQVIRTLLAQTVTPWKIVLWLAREEFPNGEESLPDELVALTRGTIFEIEWCENLLSYKKLVPALRKYPNCAIVTVDDDVLYPPDLLKRLVKAWHDNPTAVDTLRAHVVTSRCGDVARYSEWIKDPDVGGISNNFFLTGVGGVLYPPNCLDPRVTDMDLAKRIAPKGDDIWFWAMAVLKGTPINAVAGRIRLPLISGTQEESLCNGNLYGGENDQALERLFVHFPEIKAKLSLNIPPLPKNAIYCRITMNFAREGGRNFSFKLSIPLFRTKYNKNFTKLVYYFLRIPVWCRKCPSPQKSV